jgi:hypothetical protein
MEALLAALQQRGGGPSAGAAGPFETLTNAGASRDTVESEAKVEVEVEAGQDELRRQVQEAVKLLQEARAQQA